MSVMQSFLFHPVPIIVGDFAGNIVDANGTTVVNIPAHEPGDLLLAWGSDKSNTPPTTPAGFTQLTVSICDPSFTASDRSSKVVYKISDGSAQTITFDGPGQNGASTDPYSGCYIIRNATGVGNVASANTTSTGTSFTAPSITLRQPPSTLFVFTLADNISAVPGGWTKGNTGGYIEYATGWSAAVFTLSATTALIGSSIEIY
mgnify:CR=1 FL=1